MDPNSTEQIAHASFNLGRLAIDFVLPFFSLFRDETVAPTIATVMVFFAIVLAIAFLVSIVRLTRQVQHRVNFVRGCKDRQEFYTKLDEFDELMARSKLLSHSWDEYKETLLPQKPGSTLIESTVRPGDFINLTELEHSGLKLKWFHNIPGIFVGVGLLFTFIGLVAALFFASQAIHAVGGDGVDAATQTAEMQKALSQLLSTATFKFWTSIAGLGSSIVLGMLYRFLVRSLDRSLDALCRQIERCTLTVTPEVLANRQLDELREQSSQLKEFTGQLAFNLGRALEEALQKAMPSVITSAMEPMGHKVSEITSSINNLHQAMPSVMSDAMSPVAEKLGSLTQNMAQEFGSVVSENAGAEIRETAKALVSVKDALLEASKHVSGSGSGLSDQIAEAAGDLRAAAKAITDGMAGITETVRADVDKTKDTLNAQLLAATEGVSSVADVIRASLADVGGKMRTTTEEAGSAFSKQIADAVARIETGTQANATAIQQTLTQLRDMTASATGSMASETNAVVAAMRQTAEQMAQTVAEITTQIRQGSQEGVTGLTEHLVKAAEDMQEASNRNSERISDAVDRIIAAGNKAEAGVGEATAFVAKTMEVRGAEAAAKVVSGADQVLTDLKGNIQDLSGSITELWERLDKVTGAMGTVEGKIGLHAQALDDVNRAAKGTETSLSAAAASLIEAGHPLNQATQALRESIDRSSRSVEATAQTLSETQRQSSALSKEMAHTLSELQAVWNRHSGRFDKADENLGAAVIKIMDIVDKNTTRLDEQVKAIDSGLARTVGMLAGNIEELQEAANEFHEVTKGLDSAAKSLEKAASRQGAGFR
ncbi:hypothetical protein H261_19496 [Paramagnetospirillum caucaseum]|uniref:Uncharacterized protein n=1 Tax=Paramagnetospirillum caucaseum TaxID=1244869 RepID=M2Y553_9PROT|nr:anti-phage ZorAB system protein ZorA [Paramagnetospirillum caucaseum]EME68216.1 hypothetical protein H261_19496 [Paramagnetospirillum caucaseum]